MHSIHSQCRADLSGDKSTYAWMPGKGQHLSPRAPSRALYKRATGMATAAAAGLSIALDRRPHASSATAAASADTVIVAQVFRVRSEKSEGALTPKSQKHPFET